MGVLPWGRIAVGVLVSTLLAVRSVVISKSLSKDGAAAAFVVGVLTFTSGYAYAMTLLVFFLTSSTLTKHRANIKRLQDEEYRVGGQRSAVQVLCNGGLGTALAIFAWLEAPQGRCVMFTGDLADSLMLGFLGFYACCTADTWASELGSVSGKTPRLITTMRSVPPGTNGGVTIVGLLASLAGGLLVGATFVLAHLIFDGVAVTATAHSLLDFPQRNVGPVIRAMTCSISQLWLIPIAGAAGLAGSLIDSLLGATIQATYYDEDRKMIVSSSDGLRRQRISGIAILDNNAVNMVSSALTAALTAVLVPALL